LKPQTLYDSFVICIRITMLQDLYSVVYTLGITISHRLREICGTYFVLRTDRRGLAKNIERDITSFTRVRETVLFRGQPIHSFTAPDPRITISIRLHALAYPKCFVYFYKSMGIAFKTLLWDTRNIFIKYFHTD